MTAPDVDALARVTAERDLAWRIVNRQRSNRCHLRGPGQPAAAPGIPCCAGDCLCADEAATAPEGEHG